MTGEYQQVDRVKTDAVLALLYTCTEGPGEAYAILIACIHRLNFDMCESPISIDELVAEISMSLRSVSHTQKAN